MEKSAAQTSINEKKQEIFALIKECQEIAAKEGIEFIPIKELFDKYEASEAFWDTSEVCW